MRSSVRPIRRFPVWLFLIALVCIAGGWIYVYVEANLDAEYVHIMSMRMLALLGFGSLLAMIGALLGHVEDQPVPVKAKKK